MSKTMKFEDRRGRTVTVTNIENNIATLNNGEKVAVERLRDRNFFTPLNESSNSSMDQMISTSPKTTQNNSSIENDNMNIMNESVDELRYKNLVNNKSFSIGDVGLDSDSLVPQGRSLHNQSSEVRMSGSVVESHNQNLKSLGKEPMEESVPVTQPYQPNNNNNNIPNNLTAEEELLRKYGHTPPKVETSKKLEEIVYGKTTEDTSTPNPNGNLTQPQPQHIEPEVNPVHQMFDKAKKVHSLEVSLKLNEKIPSKDVIKMMEENFDESAIDYYTKDIFKRLMDNPSVIEDQVKLAIEKYLRSRNRSTTKSTTKAAPKKSGKTTKK